MKRNPIPKTTRLLTVGEFADRTSVPKRGVYVLIQIGKIKSVRLSPRRIRIPESELDRLASPQ